MTFLMYYMLKKHNEHILVHNSYHKVNIKTRYSTLLPA